jgi:hypothetical protein
VKPEVRTPYCVSVLVTTTFHCPTVAPVRLKVHVIWVEETTTTELALISPLPLRVSLTVAPERNPLPDRFVTFTVAPVTPELGVRFVMFGGGMATVKPLFNTPD